MMDRISNLPDEIACHILSFLTIEEAAFTSILSKRWRNLFALRPDLHVRYVESDYWHPKSNKSFIDFVDRVLSVSGNSTMRKFSMKIRQSVESAHISSVESAHISRWMIKVISRGILDLDLDILTKNEITLPLEIFTSKTIVKLKLGSLIGITMVPENAYLPALKTLFLSGVRFSGCAFEALLSACPVLEELTILVYPRDWKHCLTISCATLERLTLSCTDCSDDNVTRSLAFDTPRLAYLDYSDRVGDEYPIVNLDSLVEAKLSLSSRESSHRGKPKNLIKGLRNVEILHLSSLNTSMVLYSYTKSIPLFKNLSHLSIATEFSLCWSWKFLRLLLERTPNLETLVIKGPLHHSYDAYEFGICECLSEYSFLSSCPVKVLEITKYYGTKAELEHMKHFLEKLPCLEMVNVHAGAKSKLTFMTTDLEMLLPSACNIQLNCFPAKLSNVSKNYN